MRNKKCTRAAALLLAAASLCFVGAGNGGDFNWGDWNGDWNGGRPPQNAEKESSIVETVETGKTEETPEISLITGQSSEKLYLDALTKETGTQQRFMTLKRGTYTATASLSATVEYPIQHEVIVQFPYGTIYLLGTNEKEDPYREEGEVIATIHVELDPIEMARMEKLVKRLESREDSYGYYSYVKSTYEAMKKAATQTEIVMEESGYLVEHDWGFRGSKISRYRYVVADASERILSVTNQNNQFRYGQKVTVTGTVDNKKVTGTGTVVSASSRVISPELSKEKAYIRLDEGSEQLYDGRSISVSTESIRAENILLLDASCVVMKNGVPTVKVKDANGLNTFSFAIGRKSSTQYWIVDGLAEGTEVLVQ